MSDDQNHSPKKTLLEVLRDEFSCIQGPRQGVAELRHIRVYHAFDWADVFEKNENRFRGQKAASEVVQIVRERDGRCDFLLLVQSLADSSKIFETRSHGDEICVVASAQRLRDNQTKRIDFFRAKGNAIDQETRAVLSRFPRGKGLEVAIEVLSNIENLDSLDEGPERLLDRLIGVVAAIASNRISIEHVLKFLDDADESVSREMAGHLIEEYPEIAREYIQDEYMEGDVEALGYRRKQLEIFENLLKDQVFFKAKQEEWGTCHSIEATWQKFFEMNTWIFGYGLSLTFLSSVRETLEQATVGASVGTHGKRVDALMKSASAIPSLCFVEIKTHKTSLCESSPYRPGVFAPSKELASGISQIQCTVQTRDRRGDVISLRNEHGQQEGEVFHFLPKSFLVIGDLSEFKENEGVQLYKVRSFELFRRNILSPEILTFDELFERARHIVGFP
jgi:hypothetical protein